MQYYLYKKCLKFKNVPIWSEGGVNIFQKCLKFKNVPNVGGGGGVNPNGDIVPNFLAFLFIRLPLIQLTAAEKKLSQVGVGVIKSTATKK